MEPETQCLPFAHQPRDNCVHRLSTWRHRASDLVKIRVVWISCLLVSPFTGSGKVSIIMPVANRQHGSRPPTVLTNLRVVLDIGSVGIGDDPSPFAASLGEYGFCNSAC